jgi:hypothetical protein
MCSRPVGGQIVIQCRLILLQFITTGEKYDGILENFRPKESLQAADCGNLLGGEPIKEQNHEGSECLRVKTLAAADDVRALDNLALYERVFVRVPIQLMVTSDEQL